MAKGRAGRTPASYSDVPDRGHRLRLALRSTLAVRAARQLVQEPFEVGGIVRLAAAAVAAGFARLGAVSLLAPAGEGDDDAVPTPGLFPHAARGLVTIQPRHSDVHQDDLGVEPLGGFPRVDAVVSQRDFVP